MRSVRYHRHGGPDVLELDEVDRPEPGDREVLVEVKAVGVNHLDARFRTGDGHYRPRRLPATPGVDFAGVVTGVGIGVDEVEVGDRIVGDGVDAFTDYPGSYAEFLVAPVDRIAALPPAVAFEKAAAAAHVGLTAWQAIVVTGRPAPGDICLIHGAAGGVGHLAVQLAKALGATVVATAGTEAARNRVRSMGADVALDYHHDDLAQRIRDVGPPDVVLDHRLGDYLGLDIGIAARGGRIVALAGDEVSFSNTVTAVGKGLSLDFVSPAMLPDRAGTLGRLADLLAEEALTVAITDRFALAEAAEAHRALASGGHVGKLVLDVA